MAIAITAEQLTIGLRRQARSLGASTFLPRRMWPQDLLALLRLLAEGVGTDAFEQEEVEETLIPRELEYLGLLATGSNPKKIAGKLCVGETTVKRLSRSVRKKLDAATTEHAVAIAVRRGLI